MQSTVVMNSNETKRNAANNENKSTKNETVDGCRNWMILMVLIFVANLTLDNVLRFGIIKGPLETMLSVVDLIMQHWWLCRATLLYFAIQIVLLFLLEKLLALNLLREKLGMSLHVLNVFSLPTAFMMTARLSNANVFITRWMMTYILYVMTKVWSFAYVNSTYRKVGHQKISKKENLPENISKDYPRNVTINNIIEYMVFTPPIQYQISYPQRTSPDLRLFIKLVLKLFLVYCLNAFLINQFMLPEMFLMRNEGSGLIPTLRCLLKIALPMSLSWTLSIYVGVYMLYLPAYGALTGIKDVVFCKDWWNSGNLSAFWRRWNLPVYECLKYNVAIPLLRNGYSATATNIVVYAVAGILHEYLNAFPLGVYNGVAFFSTLLEIPVESITVYITKKFGNQLGNLCFWTYLVIVHSLIALQCFKRFFN